MFHGGVKSMNRHIHHLFKRVFHEFQGFLRRAAQNRRQLPPAPHAPRTAAHKVCSGAKTCTLGTDIGGTSFSETIFPGIAGLAVLTAFMRGANLLYPSTPKRYAPESASNTRSFFSTNRAKRLCAANGSTPNRIVRSSMRKTPS